MHDANSLVFLSPSKHIVFTNYVHGGDLFKLLFKDVRVLQGRRNR